MFSKVLFRLLLYASLSGVFPKEINSQAGLLFLNTLSLSFLWTFLLLLFMESTLKSPCVLNVLYKYTLLCCLTHTHTHTHTNTHTHTHTGTRTHTHKRDRE